MTSKCGIIFELFCGFFRVSQYGIVNFFFSVPGLSVKSLFGFSLTNEKLSLNVCLFLGFLRWPVRATTCTNFISIVQTLFSLYKLFFHRTNSIISVQTLFSLYKLYFHHTNFILNVQTLLYVYKLYFHRTNFIFIVQTLL